MPAINNSTEDYFILDLSPNSMEFTLAGLGEGGISTSYNQLADLYNAGFLKKIEKEDKKGDKPPTGGEWPKDGSDDDDDVPYLEVRGSNVRGTFYTIDADPEIMSSLQTWDQQVYNEILADRENFVGTIHGQLDGCGGIWEKMVEEDERNSALDEYIRGMFNEDSGLFIPTFSLDGGSGHGLFRAHINKIDNGSILSKGPRTKTFPIAVAPLESDAKRPLKSEGYPPRKGYENVLNGLDFINKRMKDNLIDATFVVDNSFAAFNEICNNDNDKDYDWVFEKRMPIHHERDFSNFNESRKGINFDNADSAIRKALTPFFMMALRAPGNVKFGPKENGYDHNDLNGIISDQFVIPSYTQVRSNKHKDNILNYDIEDTAEELAYLSYYTFLLSCAPVHKDEIEKTHVFIYSDEYSDGGIDEDVASRVGETLSDIGAGFNEVQVDRVTGIQTNDKARIWTLTGASSLKESYESKYERL